MFASLLLLGLLIFFLIFLLKPQRPKNFPPGPPTLPVLGNLLHLSTDNLLNDFERLRKSYGDVFSVFIGPQPAVVINGLKAMKEALVIKGMDFAGRPQDMFVNHVTQDIGIVLENYGPVWREHRRFALMTLRNFGLGKKSMEERIHEEIQHTIKTLENSIGTTLSPQVMFHNAASNIVCQLLFGKRFEYDDEMIKVIIKCFTDNAKIANGPWAMRETFSPPPRTDRSTWVRSTSFSTPSATPNAPPVLLLPPPFHQRSHEVQGRHDLFEVHEGCSRTLERQNIEST